MKIRRDVLFVVVLKDDLDNFLVLILLLLVEDVGGNRTEVEVGWWLRVGVLCFDGAALLRDDKTEFG